MEMKIKVQKDGSMRDTCYRYYCADDGGVLGMCYDSILRLPGMTFSLHCGICGKYHFMTIQQLRAAIIACEFNDNVGSIVIGA